tara:strand:+ start:202 stop:513 length:312 start_codon:yes stop_codon:yes gene_type:complete
MKNLKLQLAIQENQVLTLKGFQNNQITFSQCIIKLIQFQEMTENGSNEYFCEWIVDQLRNNDLPNNSSGSFMTALGDIDHLIESFENIECDVIMKTAREYSLS